MRSSNHGQKSRDTIAFLGRFPYSHRSSPSPHPKTTQKFSRVSTLYRVGEGKTARNFERMHCFKRKPRMTEKYEYCSTVPRTYVQDCSSFKFSSCMLSFDFILRWNFIFPCFKFIILHYFYPKTKENIIQTNYTFEPQHVRGQKRAFEMREIHEGKERHQICIVLDVQNPRPSILAGYVLVSSWLRRHIWHHILPWLSKNVQGVPSITEHVPKTSEGCQKTTKTSKNCKRWKRPKNETLKQQN